MNRRELLQYGAISGLSSIGGFSLATKLQPSPSPKESKNEDTIEDHIRVLEHDLMVFETENEGEMIADITGKLVNISDSVLDTVVVKADYLDGDGNYVTFETTDILDVEPDEPTDFNVPFPLFNDRDIFDQIETYELSIFEDASDIDLDKDYEFDPIDPA